MHCKESINFLEDVDNSNVIHLLLHLHLHLHLQEHCCPLLCVHVRSRIRCHTLLRRARTQWRCQTRLATIDTSYASAYYWHIRRSATWLHTISTLYNPWKTPTTEIIHQGGISFAKGISAQYLQITVLSVLYKLCNMIFWNFYVASNHFQDFVSLYSCVTNLFCVFLSFW